MFEDSLLRFEDVRSRRRKRWIALSCLVVQAAVIAMLAAVPLLTAARLAAGTEAKPKWVALARPKPVPVKPVTVRTNDRTADVPSMAQTAMQERQRALINRASVAPDSDIPVLMPFGQMRPSGPGVLAELGAGIGSGAHALVTIKPSGDGGATKPLPVSTGVSAGLLLTPIRPEYPRIAIAAHVEGVVQVTAVIDKNGRIIELKVVSGPMMLQQAAADAVREARYRPYLLNGQPTEVVTSFFVNFRMSGG